MKQKKPNKPSAPESSPEISRDRIAERARQIWEKRGQPEGQDLEHWLEAERELRGQSASTRASGEPATDPDIESDKRLDGLVQRPRES